MQKSTVFASIEDAEHIRCVDVFSRHDGTFGFEEYRRDAEDGGLWTRVQYFSPAVYPSAKAALSDAILSVAWLASATEVSAASQEILHSAE